MGRGPSLGVLDASEARIKKGAPFPEQHGTLVFVP